MHHYLEKILAAHVYELAKETPLERAPKLSARLNNDVLFKREDLQPVFSFKLRGAYNKLYQLNAHQPLEHVVAASAGNHAQGLAYAAQTLNIKATIVMPETTPRIKVDAVRHYNATVILHGDSYDEAYDHAIALTKRQNGVFIHAYDDPEVIAGQGTIATEILKQCSEKIDAIFVPVGGGGLVAGIAAYIKETQPEIKIIGVEPEDAASMYHSLKMGERTVLQEVGLFADGVAVKQVGQHTFELAKQYIDEIVLVDTDQICAAIKDIFDETRSIAEPAGALATAGIKKYVAQHDWQNKCVVSIISGANMNFDRLRHVAERAEIGERREMLIGVTIPEQPGSFRKFCSTLGKHSITEFNYRYADTQQAHIFVGVELHGSPDEGKAIIQHIQSYHYPVTNLSDNEMAKTHIRYMVGGRKQGPYPERLFRFEFPERPGALQRFLDKLGDLWSISLFHYRNHGSAHGRVLAAFYIPEPETENFKQNLKELGYFYNEETENPAYNMFLG